MAYFDTNPNISFEPDNDLPKIPLDHTKDEEFAHRYIIKLGKLLAPLRAVVPTWETKDSQGSEYNFDIAIVEDPSRAITQLRNLARGHALSQGRDYITLDDIPMLIQVVLSTCSLARETNMGSLTTSQIVESLNTSRPTALRTMTELKATGLVNMVEGVGYHNSESRIKLKDKFSWFLEDTFHQLIDHKEKCTPRTHRDLNPVLLLIYYSTINKNKISYGESLYGNQPVRGGQNSLWSNPENVIEQSNVEAYHCKQKDCPYFSYWESELTKHMVRMHPDIDPAADKEMK